MIKAYIARKMTGLKGKDLVKDALEVKAVLAQYGIEAIDPVLEEKVSNGPGVINTPRETLSRFWARDKEIIKWEADILIDRNPDLWSAGREREAGVARHFVWMPVVRIWPNYTVNVGEFEDDAIVPSIHAAGIVIREQWGTRWKRLIWRLNMLNRCFLEFVLLQLYRLVK